jgi:hypothetical protein
VTADPRRAVAVNVGANTNEPGFRGPVDADGGFSFLPIPETEATRSPVPTYGDLAPHLAADVPTSVHDTPVHLDPTFAEYPRCTDYTYGDPYPVKAGPLGDLSARDYVCFYATLSVAAPADWLPPSWGAFLIGHFRLAADPVSPGGDAATLTDAQRERYAANAHLRRETFDARVLLAGDPDHSRIYDRAVPLSRPTGGTDPNALVTDHSGDSGRGPWWRRPLRFRGAGARELLDRIGESPEAP